MKDFIGFKKTIKNRNAREWLACLFVTPTFIYMGLNKNTLLGKLFCFEIAAAAIFIAYYIYSKSHVKLKNVVESLDINKVVKDEIKLLQTVKFWYVLPIFIGLVGLTVEGLYLDFSNDRSLVGGLVYLVSVCSFGVFIIYLNEKKGVQELRGYLNN